MKARFKTTRKDIKALIPRAIALIALAAAVPCAAGAGSSVKFDFARRDGNPIPKVRHEPAVFYIAENGSDENDGSAERPLATLQRAVALTRLVERDCERRIVFRDGYYSFSKRVNLNSTDWDLVITGEHPGGAVLSGSIPVTGWHADPEFPGVWVADMPMEEASDDIQYAFVCNGAKRTVATFPDTASRVSFDPNGSKRNVVYNPSHMQGVQFDKIDLSSAWLSVQQEWSTTLSKIATNDVANHAFWLGKNLKYAAGTFDGEGFQLCNTCDGLGVAGAWMFSCAERKIRYRPMWGEKMDEVQAQLTELPCILHANRTCGLVVSNLVFEGCSRDYAFTGGYTMPHNAPLSLYYTYDTVIDGVEIRNCAYDGIGLTKPTRTVIRNCNIHDIGACGIYFYDSGNGVTVVEGNTIHDFGQTKDSANGVYFQAYDSRIVGNTIYNGPRGGVTMWGDRLVCASNHFYNVMLKSEDGGALYGAYNDSLISDNYVHGINDADRTVFGLYCDEGGQRNLFTRNTVEGMMHPIHNHHTQFDVVSNNVFKSTYLSMLFSFQGSGHGVFCDNKIYQSSDSMVDSYYANCDFWGRNELFVNGVSQGLFTAVIPKPYAGSMYAKNITGKKDSEGNPLVPIDGEGNVNWNAFDRTWSQAVEVGAMECSEAGCYVKGVPSGTLYAAYDATYLYLGVRRAYNGFKNYTGCKNVNNGGWRHCDAWRVVFGTKPGWTEVRTIDVYPKSHGFCVADASLGISSNDVGYVTVSGNPSSLVRVRRDKIGVEAGVSGTVNFNAMIWSEDLREMRMLYPAKGDTDPSGAIMVR